jgi:hypothetical protein
MREQSTEPRRTQKAYQKITMILESKPWIGRTLLCIYGILFFAAFIGIFLSARYPWLNPFVHWMLWIYAGIFVAFIAGIMIIGPGIYVANTAYETVKPYNQVSILEERLTIAWASCAGLLFSLLIAGAIAVEILGPIENIKLWFIGVCYTVLIIHWIVIGFLGRKLIRRFSPPRK